MCPCPAVLLCFVWRPKSSSGACPAGALPHSDRDRIIGALARGLPKNPLATDYQPRAILSLCLGCAMFPPGTLNGIQPALLTSSAQRLIFYEDERTVMVFSNGAGGAMPEIGLLPFARVAMNAAAAVLPPYRSRFSKHQFTQPQLLAILCLMRLCRLDFPRSRSAAARA